MSKQTDLLNLTDAITVDSSNNVGIGVTNPSDYYSTKLVVNAGGGEDGITIVSSTAAETYLMFADGTSGNAQYRGYVGYSHADDYLRFATSGSDRMRIDSWGNLLVGKTASSITDVGAVLNADGIVKGTADSSRSGHFNRKNSDGQIIRLDKDGSTVGSIGAASGDMYLGTDNTGFRFVNSDSSIRPFDPSTGSIRDNAIDLGSTAARFDDIFATNGAIQTSDRNEKQDIEALSDAEQRVAVACKGLLRKFRWIDAVAEKGDDARIHFGIIAQDLHDAFAAEGLDAGRYAMFISSTWWEHDVEVPAVEADEENGIEAKEAYTRTDTYETLEEAPEGATERTRLGVRYPELLAFIIGAM